MRLMRLSEIEERSDVRLKKAALVFGLAISAKAIRSSPSHSPHLILTSHIDSLTDFARSHRPGSGHYKTECFVVHRARLIHCPALICLVADVHLRSMRPCL